MSLQVSTFYTLWNQRNRPDKILKLMVTMTRSKVKSRSHHDVAHLQPPSQCPYKVSTSYTLRFPRYSPDNILYIKDTTARSKVKSRSHHDIVHLHPSPIALPCNNFLHLMVSEIQPGQDLIGQGHYGKVKGHIKVTP